MDQAESSHSSLERTSRPPRNFAAARGLPFKNKQWINGSNNHPSPSEGRWERGGHRGGSGRGRGGSNGVSVFGAHKTASNTYTESTSMTQEDGLTTGPSQLNDKPKTWEELVKAREAERIKAIREGKMDDPSKPKRLDEAITIVGTCQDKCPEFERYRRERENNLDKWECLVGPDGKPTKKVDHEKAVKIYERGQGDKIIPSDLRPPPVLQRTLNYLFYDLLPRGGFAETQAFIRDRSRAVRNDFTIQLEMGVIAMESHERCARYHILSLHVMHGVSGFDRALEIQQLMNSLLSLREFYAENRGRYQSPNELEMRIYHRLGLIRDQQDRNDQTPDFVQADPAFKLVSQFRSEVQAASVPITKTSKLIASEKAMGTFQQLAGVLNGRGNTVMIFLIACFLENIFGRDTIDNIEGIAGGLSHQDIIDGVSHSIDEDTAMDVQEFLSDEDEAAEIEQDQLETTIPETASAMQPAVPGPSANVFQPQIEPTIQPSPPAFQSVFGQTGSVPSIFGPSAPSNQPVKSVFGGSNGSIFGSSSSSAPAANVFGGSVFAPSRTISQPSAPVTFQPIPDAPTTTNLQKSSFTSNGIGQQEQSFLTQVPAPQVAPLSGPSTKASPDYVQPNTTSNPFLSSSFQPAAPSFPLNSNGTPLPSLFNKRPETPSLSKQPPLSLNTGSVTQEKEQDKHISSLSPYITRFPSRLFIDTKSPVPPEDSHNDAAPESPFGPPPLKRVAPISLPGTPTLLNPLTPLSRFPPSQAVFGSPPQFIATPIQKEAPITLWGTPSRSLVAALKLAAPNPSPTPVTASTPALASDSVKKDIPPTKTNAEMKEEALSFSRRSLLVQDCFQRWRDKYAQVKSWQEACKRSENYRHKVHNDSVSTTASVKRRRISDSVSISDRSVVRRRIMRKSHQTPQEFRNDEELAKRFSENKKDHELRWARGSYVNVMRERFRAALARRSAPWNVWLGLNQNNDRTAIWLEEKFDVPSAGFWESDMIFSIPISAKSREPSYPGLIIFECSPLDDIPDELERKYVVLDDCTRLRDIINSLSEDRYFVPSLLFVNWGEVLPAELADMARSYLSGERLTSYSTFTITNDTCLSDKHFNDSLDPLDIDFEGRLVEWLTLEALSEEFSSLWRENVGLWIQALEPIHGFRWQFFRLVLRSTLGDLQEMIRIISHIWDISSMTIPPIASLDIDSMDDVQSALESLRDWLQAQKASETLTLHILSTTDVDEAVLPELFFNVVHNALLHHLSRHTPNGVRDSPIPKSNLQSSLSAFETILKNSTMSLRVAAKSLPSSPRRRSRNGVSQLGSSASSYTTSAEPSLVSPSENGVTELTQSRPPSPTPSVAASAAESTTSVVTVTMLRALARDVLKAYPKR